MIKSCYWYYPQVLEHAAHEFALARVVVNQKNGASNKPGADAGIRNIEIDERGILAELIAYHVMREKKIPFSAARILDVYPVASPDIVVTKGGVKIGVKGFDRDTANINKDAHEKTRVDFYMIVRMFRDILKADIYFESYSNIYKWSLVPGPRIPTMMYQRKIESDVCWKISEVLERHYRLQNNTVAVQRSTTTAPTVAQGELR